MQHTMIRALVISSLLLGGLGLGTRALAQESLVPTSGAEQKLALEAKKTASVATVAPGKTVTYTIVITNTGNVPAAAVKLQDILPIGFTVTTTGSNTYDFAFMGSLEPGKSFSTSYTANLASDLANGSYVNVASVSATGVDPITVRSEVQVLKPEVKGASTTVKVVKKPVIGKVLAAEDVQLLAATGVGQLDVFIALLGATLVGAGLLGLRRRSQTV